jgi:hypothetical protein
MSRHLYVCEFCLKYFYSLNDIAIHKTERDSTCNKLKGPPGIEIYKDSILADVRQRDQVTRDLISEDDPRHFDSVSVFLVDGKSNKLYCQNLCLVGKLFLDHKTLFFDIDAFQFFVLTENNHRYSTRNIVGYFCRE